MSTPCNIPNELINGIGTGSGTYALLSGMFRHNFSTESTRTSPGDEEESGSGSDISSIENMTDSDSC